MDSWEAFWRTNGWELKGANVPVKDRRYALALQGDFVFLIDGLLSGTSFGVWKSTGKAFRSSSSRTSPNQRRYAGT